MNVELETQENAHRKQETVLLVENTFSPMNEGNEKRVHRQLKKI